MQMISHGCVTQFNLRNVISQNIPCKRVRLCSFIQTVVCVVLCSPILLFCVSYRIRCCVCECVSAIIVTWQIALEFATFLYIKPFCETRVSNAHIMSCAKQASCVRAKVCVFSYLSSSSSSSSLNLCMQIISWLFDLAKRVSHFFPFE